jgi:hypothetical protein
MRGLFQRISLLFLALAIVTATSCRQRDVDGSLGGKVFVHAHHCQHLKDESRSQHPSKKTDHEGECPMCENGFDAAAFFVAPFAPTALNREPHSKPVRLAAAPWRATQPGSDSHRARAPPFFS